MSKNATSQANQQGSLAKNNSYNPSETTRRTPITKICAKSYLLGAAHDGSINKVKRFRFTQKEKGWLEFVKKMLKRLGYNSWLYKEGKSRKVYALETLAPFLVKESASFNPLSLKTTAEKKCYLRGFFDAEGGIPQSTTQRLYIQLAQKDYQKIRFIKNILNSLSINTGKIHNPSRKRNPDYWRIYVSAKDYKAFIDKIDSWHPRKKVLLHKFRVKI